MNFEFTPEQKELQDRAIRFRKEICEPLEPTWPINDYDAPVEQVKMLRDKFREWGFQAMTVPKEAGGHGMTCMDKLIVYSEMVKSKTMCGMLPNFNGFIDPPTALYSASDKLKEKYLKPLIEDSAVFHIHISEPDAGTDAAGIKTTAVKDGDSWIINGRKRWAPPPNHWAITPQFFTCYAITTPGIGYKGVSLFLVDWPSEGLTCDGWCELHEQGGYIGRSSYDYVYNNVRVPAENLLGEEGKGFNYMMDQLNRNRIVISATLLAKAEVALNRAIEYAKKRETFGAPLSTRQAIQFMVCECATKLEQNKLMCYKAATKLDHGEDVRLLTAMIKAEAPVAAAYVIDRAMQIMGGNGMRWDNGMARMYWQCRINQVAEGAVEIMKQTAGKMIFKGRTTD